MKTICILAVVVGAIVSRPSAWAQASLFDNAVARVEISAAFADAGNLMKPDAKTFPATVVINGMSVGQATFKFVPQSLRNSEKPSFELTFIEGNRAPAPLQATNLLCETSELSHLTQFAVSRLGQRFGLPVSPVGHMVLTLNKRGLGLYTIVGKSFGAIEAAGSNAHLFAGNAELSEMAGLDQFAGESNIVAGIIRTCLDSDKASRIEKLGQSLDLSEFYRLMAFEAVIGDDRGYSDGGNSGVVAVRLNDEQIRFYPQIHTPAFEAILRPILTRKRGLIARALIEVPEGQRAYVQAVSALVTNSTIEQTLIRELGERRKLLEPFLSGARDESRLNRSHEVITRHIAERFAAVRSQLASLPAALPSADRLPVMKMSADSSGKGLPIKNPRDYGRKLAALVKTNTVLTSSVPIKIYSIAIEAPTNVLETLSWKSTNWISVNCRADQSELANVGFRLKGHGTRQGLDKKPSFTLKFNRYDENQSFRGATKLHAQNSSADPSYLNQFIASWLYQKLHYPVAKIEFAEVQINQKPYGLYVISEGITKNFLRREFGAGNGLLFEGEVTDLSGPMQLDSGELPAGYAWRRDAHLAAQRAGAERRLNGLETYFDLDAFTRFCATEWVLGHRDGYVMSHSNYRIYQKAPDAPFVFVPHGMDWLFFDSEGAFPRASSVMGKALFRAPEGRKQFLEEGQTVLAKGLDMDTLVIDAAIVVRALQPILRKLDPTLAEKQLTAAMNQLRLLGDRRTYLSKEFQLHQRFGQDLALH